MRWSKKNAALYHCLDIQMRCSKKDMARIEELEADVDKLAPIKFDREAADEILKYISPEDFETAIKSGLVKLTHKVPDDS